MAVVARGGVLGVTVTGPLVEVRPAIEGRNAGSEDALRTVLRPNGLDGTVELKRVGDPRRVRKGALRLFDPAIAPHPPA